MGRTNARWILGTPALAVLVALLLALPAEASGYIAQLKRYPYLTDLVGTSVGVNWGTDRSSINGAVKWGKVGTESCTAHTTVGTRTAITVNGVSQYQWRASISGLQPDTEYCYRVYFGAGFTTDLLGTDASPTFRTQIPAGASTPYKFAVFGDWGKVGATGNPDQANVMTQIAQSGARFAVTTGDNAYDVGSQKDYGDLYQTGSNTSAVFGPNFWKVPGSSVPLFPTLGNHDHNNSVLLTNWPQPTATATSDGRYETETYCCLNGTQSTAYPSAWYAFDAGNARFYVLDAAWEDSNSGTATVEQNDYDNHWTPTSDQYEWLANDLATHPRQLKFAFWHFPMYSDNAGEGSDPYLQGVTSLEGLLKLYDVTLGFSGHAHSYQRFLAPAGGIPTFATGGGGAGLDQIGSLGCSPLNAYSLGWNSPRASAAPAAPRRSRPRRIRFTTSSRWRWTARRSRSPPRTSWGGPSIRSPTTCRRPMPTFRSPRAIRPTRWSRANSSPTRSRPRTTAPRQRSARSSQTTSRRASRSTRPHRRRAAARESARGRQLHARHDRLGRKRDRRSHRQASGRRHAEQHRKHQLGSQRPELLEQLCERRARP